MSHSDAGRLASFAGSDADRRAAAAVVEHHAQLAQTLANHLERLRAAAAGGSRAQVLERRDALLAWLRTELVPHAQAEEAVLYPAAAGRTGGRLVVDGMLAEHRAIIALVDELADATTGLDVIAATRALAALFAVHLEKENDLILPLLLAAEESSVAALLDGLHDLIGASAGDGCGSGGECGCRPAIV